MPSKISPALKALITSPHARGTAIPAPSSAVTDALFGSLHASAKSHGVGKAAWLTLSTSALVTLNSPETLCRLYSYAKGPQHDEQVQTALIMREAGLKCITLCGVPRPLNALNALRDALPSSVASALPTEPTRHLTPSNVTSVVEGRSRALWDDIYANVSSRLIDKLAASHPDLPVYILESHYGALLSNPPSAKDNPIGRVLTSVVAVSCLRAQGGVGPQVMSHIMGLRRSMGSKEPGTKAEVEGEEWLATDEGSIWVLNMVDKIVEAVANGDRTFAPIKAKL